MWLYWDTAVRILGDPPMWVWLTNSDTGIGDYIPPTQLQAQFLMAAPPACQETGSTFQVAALSPYLSGHTQTYICRRELVEVVSLPGRSKT